jgi:hypothetical protein
MVDWLINRIEVSGVSPTTGQKTAGLIDHEI